MPGRWRRGIKIIYKVKKETFSGCGRAFHELWKKSLFSSFCIVSYNGIHFVPVFPHVMDELELCTGAVKVLSRTVGGKVVVTFQVIGQKAYATLQCHQFCIPWQCLNFQRGKGIPGFPFLVYTTVMVSRVVSPPRFAMISFK